MHGAFGRILKIDLERGVGTPEPLDAQLCTDFLGGKGIASHLLLQANPPGVDPLSKDNRVIFATGFAAGTKLWGSTRHGVFTKSPLTNTYTESYSGGSAALAMARTGYDAIVIEGAAASPVFLEISDRSVVVHSAADLWGMDAYETETELLRRVPVEGARALVIGPAGENLVRFACINNDFWRCSGRTGAGAVLGSKRLKGLVFHGDATRDIADPDLLKAFNTSLAHDWKTHPRRVPRRMYGTVATVDALDAVGAFPSKYWAGASPSHIAKLNGEALHRELNVRPKACPSCFIACANLSEVRSGRHAGLRLEGPEYETIAAFGGLCMVADLAEITYLNDICDRYGIDTMTAGNLCGFAIEASRRGCIDDRLEYGDADGMARVLRKMVAREGYGDVLAEGIRHAAREWGMEDVAIHVKGLEPAAIDPRTFKGMALSYAVSVRGACHLRASFYVAEMAGKGYAGDVDETVRRYIDHEDMANVYDSTILCRFFKDVIDWPELQTIIRAIMGLERSSDELREIGARVQGVAHEYNRREGLSRDDDALPERFYREALPGSGNVLDRDVVRRLVDRYWELRGWDA